MKGPALVLLALLTGLLPWGLAQTLYLPLDDRPPNWAPCAWGLVLCPPKAAYRGPEGADLPGLRAWLLATPGERLVASLDALAYGGLLPSRHLPLSPEDALARLGPLLSWRVRHRGELLLFGVVPRWDATRRGRNLEVLGRLAPWASLAGVYLEAVWDDAVRGSPAPQEARALPYPSRPGADEAGQVLLLRALSPGLRVALVYEGEGLADRVTPYEGLPLRETVAGLLGSAGAQEVALAEGPDLVLYAYGGQDPRGALLDLLHLMGRYPVALADLSRVNRGDPRLMAYLQALGLYGRLFAYASWGTPANNLGSALAQGGLALGDRGGRRERLAEAYFHYWWGEVGRPFVRAHFPEPLPEEARGVAALWRAPELDGHRVALRGLEFPWGRSFEARGRLQLVPGDRPVRLVE
ncbi:DUF4127 family protein [Thermus thermamylovorans]|uniref:DUF4127 family protein n=1 Tax=Thermus thermamylovorans TaxID=2509362 RepID=A0A4Q9AZB4_9DEIN|nr:DUF4127 family protein [Thermus thermamylovorans]TBH17511.1 DUF4127 family protein [Thermus thermamylovorans]